MTLKPGLGSLKVIANDTTRQIAYIRVPIAFHSNYGPILYYFRDKAKYWSEIAIFSYPAFEGPVNRRTMAM